MATRFLVVAISLGMAATLHAREPIAGVKATATSAQVAGLFGPQNLCTDTGLTDTGRGDGSRRLTTNGYAGGGCMWHSAYLPFGPDELPLVQFDLGRVTIVDRFHVWNHNANPSRGFHNVSMLISEDGKTWKPLGQRFRFAKAPRTEDYCGESHSFDPPIQARYIRFICEGTHRTGGQPELAGLGKVRFYAAAPGTVAARETPGIGRIPMGAGVINVRLAPYNARGDGQTDDTEAIQKALEEWQGTSRIVYLPAGIYLVSRSLRYQPGRGHGGNNLRGAGIQQTTIRLKEDVFRDPQKPQPVLTLGFNGRPDGSGVHADWFNNNVSDLTIEVSPRNPGAIGIQYYSNNVGALRNIRLLAQDGLGHTGLDLAYADQNGPCLAKNIHIKGFATGVRTGSTVNSQTLEEITIEGAKKIGWENAGQCLSIRRLKVQSTGLGFVNTFGVVSLLDAEFVGSGSASEQPAIRTQETLFARNIRVQGHQQAIENRRNKNEPTGNAVGSLVEEWVSTPPLTLFPHTKPRSLNLPVEETPDVAWDDVSTWANVRTFRELTDPDDTASLQRAMDSGASTIYFPSGGRYIVSQPVELRGTVRRLLGYYSHVTGPKQGAATLRLGPDGPPLVMMQEFRGHLHVEHTGPGTLVVRDGQGTGGALQGKGKLFLENVVADWSFAEGKAWARQLNNETLGTHLRNTGATLWILGLKTERGGTLIDTQRGATELLGGLCYTTNEGKRAPMFTSLDARVSYMIGEVCYTGDPYTRLIEERRGSEVRGMARGQAPLRAAFLQGSEIPLFVGNP